MKLFIYPQASPHVHDNIPKLIGCVPLSKDGIARHFEVITDPKQADYYYMGQIREDSKVPLFKSTGEEFEFYKGNESRHIADMEGEGGWEIPSWLHNCILTTMGPLKRFNIKRLFTRPTFSTLMIDLVKDNRKFDFPEKRAFGFRGLINHNIRSNLYQAIQEPILDEMKVSREVYTNNCWSGSVPSGHEIQRIYEELMLKHPLSLCPRGAGIDTTRIIETCFYTRVPVIITDEDFHLVGEDSHDMSFCFRIVGNMTPKALAEELIKVYNTDMHELKDRANAARNYFDVVIKKYFEDPTLYFLNWLNKNESK